MADRPVSAPPTANKSTRSKPQRSESADPRPKFAPSGCHEGPIGKPTLQWAWSIFRVLVQASFGLAACSLAIANHICAPPSAVAATVDHYKLAQDFPTATETGAPAAAPAYPLKASTNHRYLVDQNNVPFLMVGDASQTLIATLSPAEAAIFMADRRRFGINTLWINLLCNYSDVCNKDASTIDGISPFIVSGDLTTPNPAYFRRADDMIAVAAANGMVVLLNPLETSGWLEVLRSNGPTKALAYGQYLGNRYKDVPNIIWMYGNDFQTWRNATDDTLVQAVARGIRSADGNHLHTIELNYYTSGSLDDPSWAPLIDLDAAYTYFPTYAQVLNEYNRADFKPVFMVEANYEFEHFANTDGGSTQNLRRQEYWTMLSGACGQLYGSAYTWRTRAPLADRTRHSGCAPTRLYEGFLFHAAMVRPHPRSGACGCDIWLSWPRRVFR